MIFLSNSINSAKHAFTAVSNTIVKQATSLLPLIPEILTRLASEHKSIEKILIGVSSASCGAYLILKNIRPPLGQDQEALAKKASRCGQMALGGPLLALGIIAIASGVEELFVPSGTGFLSHQTPPTACDARLVQAKELFLRCPAAKAVWDRVAQQGSFSIQCVPPEEAPFGAQVGLHNRIISIANSTNTDPMVSSILFELHNLRQVKRVDEVSKVGCSLSVNEYALRMETIEFSSAEGHHKVAQECVPHWPSHFDEYKSFFDQPDPLKADLETAEAGGHTDYFRKAWHTRCDKK